MNGARKTNGSSLREIARRLKISKGAVSLALNDSPKISAATKKLVRETARKLGYKKIPLVSRVMSSLKQGKKNGFLETIVLINANPLKNADEKFPIFSEYIKGVKTEAEGLGYAVFRIWLRESALTPGRLREILVSRGIRGGIIIGHVDDTILPEKFSEVWRNFKFVSAGLRTFKPALDFISADKFLIARHAAKVVVGRGYKRPALVVDRHIDDLVDGRFTGGFLRAQLDLPESARIPPFTDVSAAAQDHKVLLKWLSKYKPDAVFTLSNDTAGWLKTSGILKKFPARVKFVELERKSETEGWIAIDKNYELVGRLAVRKLFELLNMPARLENIGIATATIVQPNLNDSI